MKIALIGYGKMGVLVEQTALSRGHEITVVIDKDNRADFASPAFASAEVAIEFTTPQAAADNIRRSWAAGVPVVSGTTGWSSELDKMKREAAEGGHTLFWSSNFSLGVHLFMMVNNYLARLMNRFPQYEAGITEVHHTHKLDAPSGTAITLAEGIIGQLARKSRWVKGEATSPEEMGIRSVRQGEVPGIHTVCYDSAADSITLTHQAKSREGFALGAVIAAEFTAGRKGFLSMDDLLPPWSEKSVNTKTDDNI